MAEIDKERKSWEVLDAAAKQCIDAAYERPDKLAAAIRNLADARCDVYAARNKT
ncbi:hypothetical protein LCGC14_1978470 [marine sediment metagenome]|uniref:Uncharacterized protein n=1 Tax=marine sediment metagenome TaxID=412755 RepID=A0A0F9GKR4_9ZZZZ